MNVTDYKAKMDFITDMFWYTMLLKTKTLNGNGEVDVIEKKININFNIK